MYFLIVLLYIVQVTKTSTELQEGDEVEGKWGGTWLAAKVVKKGTFLDMKFLN